VFKETESGMLDVSPQIAPGRENQFTASYRQELMHFVEGVRRGQVFHEPREQATLMRVITAAYQSAELETEIHF